MASWSDDPRKRLMPAVERGGSAAAAAQRFDVNASAAIKRLRRITLAELQAGLGGRGIIAGLLTTI